MNKKTNFQNIIHILHARPTLRTQTETWLQMLQLNNETTIEGGVPPTGIQTSARKAL